MLYIANGDKMVDTVPMHEIRDIVEMNADPSTIMKRPSVLSTNLRTHRLNPSETAGAGGGSLQRSLAATERQKDIGTENESERYGRSNLAIQINTIPDGFNLGKTYYLRAILNASNRTMVPKLTVAATAAKARFLRKSLFR